MLPRIVSRVTGSGLMSTLTQIAKAARGSPNRSTCVSRPRSARCRRTFVAHLCYKEGAGGTIMHLSVLTSTNPPTHQPTNPPLAPTHHGIHHGGSYAMHHGMHMACSMQCTPRRHSSCGRGRGGDARCRDPPHAPACAVHMQCICREQCVSRVYALYE